jgi:GTP-binding protein EngB required for normal cell division
MSTPLDRRLEALADAVELARGRMDEERVARAEAVLARAGRRLGLGVEATVVALAGPTGAGKSSLFNALAGEELVAAGRRRPMTATATAAVWGEVPDELLDWLEVPRRHRLDGRRSDGLVLLDLPDFDSVETAHRDEVERVIELADLLVWVVDPQKYADAAWHERYVRPLASHSGVMEVVLNQADLLDEGDVAACRRDLQRLLHADGVDGVPVHAASAVTGQGLGELEQVIGRRVAGRAAVVERLEADVGAAAGGLAGGCDGGRTTGVGRGERERLVAALAEAAGVPGVVRAVDRAHRRRGALRTGWPAARWVRRLRPDPLRRLRLPDRADDAAPRPSLGEPTAVQRAGVSTAVRSLAEAASRDLGQPWPRLVREAAAHDEARAAEVLRSTMGEVDLHVTRPRWWIAVDALQKLLMAVTVIGALWLVGLAALGWLQLGDIIPTPDVRGIAIPTLMAVGGALAGLLVALVARVFTAFGARRRARRADRALRRRVTDVAGELVIGPVESELAARERLCAALAQARGEGRGRGRWMRPA